METTNELISVIVPVYKVEKDLTACVASIVSQSYKNLEIILVDDGSPDRCPEICDELSKTDDRITVMHKKNGGLSDARNAALSVCHGEYILFVDSDDLINRDLIATLYSLCVNNDAEIAVCDYIAIPTDKFKYEKIKVNNVRECVVEDLLPEKALTYMMDVYKTFQVAAWNKLYKASLFDEVRYPVGIYYEDIATTYKLISKSNKIMYIHAPLYYYQLRSNSITRSGFNQRDLDKISNSTELLEFIKTNYPNIRNEAMVYKYVYCYMTIVSKILFEPNAKKNKYLNMLIIEMRGSQKEINLKVVPFKKRMAYQIMIISPMLYKLLFIR